MKYIVALLLWVALGLANASTADWVSQHAKIPKSQAERYVDIIDDVADHYGVDSRVVTALIMTESTFDYRAHGCGSHDPCYGLMQVKYRLHARETRYKNLPLTSPLRNVDTGTRLLKSHLKDNGGDYFKALQDYNASPKKKRYARKIISLSRKIPLS